MARFRPSRLPQEAKIYIVIILLIAVPSLVLTWMATLVLGQEARSINQKTEQIHRNAVNEVARRALNVLSEVGRSVAALTMRPDFLDAKMGHVIEALERERRRLPILDLYFVYDERGVSWIPIGNRPSLFWNQKRFRASPQHPALLQARRQEFVDKDYPGAIAAYQQAARAAGNDAVLLTAALNGEARCQLRLGQYDTAMDRYFALQGRHFSYDSSGLPAELIARYQIGHVLRLQDKPIAFVNQRLQFLRWLLDRETVMIIDPSQRAFYQQRVRQELQQALEERPQAYAREREALAQVEREGQQVLAREQAEQQLLQWLTAQVYPRVVGDMRAGAQGPRAPVFVGGALASGDPAAICYGLYRRPQDGSVKWVIGFVLSRDLLRSRLDPAKVPELSFLEQSNLRIQVLDGAGRLLVGRPDSAATVLYSRRLSTPYPPWQVQMIAVGPVPVPAAVKTRTALLFGLVLVSAVALGLGIFVTIWTSSREIRTARMRSDFVSAVTHELKTPLTSISMFAETLQMGRYRNEQDRQAYVEAISEESQRLSRLIERVLNFASIERGTRAYRFGPVDPAALVRETLDSMRAQLEREGAQVVAEIEPGLPPVRGDRDALAEVLVNLLGNALKYSPSDKRMHVRAQRADGEVWIGVTDFGIGISRREQKRVFDKFYRASDRRVQETEGTGLGLTVSRSVARAHGGDLRVDSQPGKGSTFTLVLPVAGATCKEEH